jgi:hypothetical protein
MPTEVTEELTRELGQICNTRSSRAMEVVNGIQREVKVDDMVDICPFEIEPSSCQVRAHQYRLRSEDIIKSIFRFLLCLQTLRVEKMQ